MPTYSTWKQKKPKKPKASVPGRYGIQRPTPKPYGMQPPPGAPAKAPVRPPAPPPGPQGLPFDPTYESTIGNSRRQYDTTTAGLQYQEGRVRQDYGFDDASDPFSKARMLERNFLQATRGRLNTAGNNLYSSSFNRGEEVGRFNYEGDVNTARKSYADALQSITQQRAQALTDKTGAESSAASDRIYRAQENREDPGPAPVAPPAPKPKKKKYKGKRPGRG